MAGAVLPLYQTPCHISIPHPLSNLSIKASSAAGLCVAPSVCFPVGTCASVSGAACCSCCLRASPAQICYILLPGLMGTSLHWYRVVLLQAAIIPFSLPSLQHVCTRHRLLDGEQKTCELNETCTLSPWWCSQCHRENSSVSLLCSCEGFYLKSSIHSAIALLHSMTLVSFHMSAAYPV